MIKYIAVFGVFLLVAFFAPAQTAVSGKPSAAEDFLNPAKLDQATSCAAENIDAGRFGISYTGKTYSV